MGRQQTMNVGILRIKAYWLSLIGNHLWTRLFCIRRDCFLRVFIKKGMQQSFRQDSSATGISAGIAFWKSSVEYFPLVS
jgi:hypothetical protein